LPGKPEEEIYVGFLANYRGTLFVYSNNSDVADFLHAVYSLLWYIVAMHELSLFFKGVGRAIQISAGCVILQVEKSALAITIGSLCGNEKYS